MKPKVYSIGCPKCNILEEKMVESGIDFDLISDEEEVKRTGFQFFPVLEVDSKLFDFYEAINWLKGQGE